MNKTNNAVGSNWNDFRNEHFSPEEIAEIDLKVALIGEIVNARNEKGISQRQLEELTGIKQPAIARIETGKNSPSLDTVVKVLAALGKKLQVVPLEK